MKEHSSCNEVFPGKKEIPVVNGVFSFLEISSPQQVTCAFENVEGKLQRQRELCVLKVCGREMALAVCLICSFRQRLDEKELPRIRSNLAFSKQQ